MANVPTTSWNETKPAGTRAINLGDNDIREMKTQLREVITVDHEMGSSGQDTDWGYHNQVTLLEQADIGTGAEGIPILGAQTVSGKAELVFTDEDDNDVQLTSGGVIPLSSARLSNDAYLLSVDNAGTGTVNLIKANTSDELETGVKLNLGANLVTNGQSVEFTSVTVTDVVDQDDMSDDSATKLATQQSIKAYVDSGAGSKSLGAWDTKTYNTVYQASTDGFVHVETNDARVRILTDGSNPPTTARTGNNVTDNQGCMSAVKTGDYWEADITKTGSGWSVEVYWIPLS